jgi:hypothetical protein
VKKILRYSLFLSVFMFGSAYAELYYELGFEAGGDELASTTAGESISAGGGFKFAIGIQNRINETASYRLVAGYLFDDLDAVDGSAESSALTFDALYMRHIGAHSFGIGGTMHLSPEYSENSVFGRLDLEFDNAVGLLLQYGYHFSPSLEVGVRLSDLTYKVNNVELDAGSFGLYLSNGF